VSRFAGHRQVVGSGAAGLVGAAGQAAMARPVMSAQIRTAWAVVEALVLTMLDPGHDLPLGRAIALQLVGVTTPNVKNSTIRWDHSFEAAKGRSGLNPPFRSRPAACQV
jgi:hypothetical protein